MWETSTSSASPRFQQIDAQCSPGKRQGGAFVTPTKLRAKTGALFASKLNTDAEANVRKSLGLTFTPEANNTPAIIYVAAHLARK